MKVVWTDEAICENNKNIKYLIKNWDENVLDNYLNKLEKTTEHLESNILTGMFDKELGLYKILVVEQIYLFYEMDNNVINIIAVFNNNQFPYWL